MLCDLLGDGHRSTRLRSVSGQIQSAVRSRPRLASSSNLNLDNGRPVRRGRCRTPQTRPHATSATSATVTVVSESRLPSLARIVSARALAAGETDLHCDGVDTGERLPGWQLRFPRISAGPDPAGDQQAARSQQNRDESAAP